MPYAATPCLTSPGWARNHSAMGMVASVRAADLLERGDALATLGEALAEARLGQGRLIFVGGEAGAGKTTLVRAFCGSLGEETRVLSGACDPLSTPRPLGPFVDMADECTALADALASGRQPSEVFAALYQELAGGWTVLVLEDLHWGDEATFDVLRLLARRIDVSVLVICTFRDDGLGRAHPLRVLAGDLASASAVGRLTLQPLSREAVAALAVGYPVDPADLYERTGGNPFFVAQSLAAGGSGVPPTVRDAVLARIAGLPNDALEVLETVSLTLPRAEWFLLEAVLGDAVATVEGCEATGLVAWDDDAMSFRHELARASIAAAIPPTRRVSLERRILAALRQAERDIDPARLAHHAEAAQDTEAVLELAPAAAARASATGAYREAAAQYARALRAGGSALPPGRRAELLEGRSRACYLADDQLEAIAVIRGAIECRAAEGAAQHEARNLSELSSYLRCRGLLQEAREAIAAATSLIDGCAESAEVAFVESARSIMAWTDGDSDEASALGWRAREMALRTGDGRTAVNALITVGSIELESDLEQGRELVEQALHEALAAGFSEQAARALNNLGAVSGDAELADTYLPQALEYCVTSNEDLWRINGLALAARHALDRGRWTEATDFADQLLRDPRESPWPHHEALLVLALVRARRGDPGASQVLTKAVEVGVPTDEVGAHVDLAAARAEVSWLEQHPLAVDEATASAARLAAERGDAASLARLDFWRRLAGLGTATEAGADVADPFALAAAGRFAAAAAEWERSCRPYEAALALLEQGDEASLRNALERLQALGAGPAAQLASRRLRLLGARSVARGPRRVTRQNAAGLTPRECDVLSLLAKGSRNTEIAEQLFLSCRTVDHHVSAILRKLDARSRGEAVAAAGRFGLLEDR